MSGRILDGELRAKIDDFKRNEMSKFPPEVIGKLMGALDEMVASGLAAKALGVGERAPDFRLPDARGGAVTLSEKLGHGPAVITFYRGGW